MSETSEDPRILLLLGLLRRQEMHGYQLNEFLLEELAACASIKKPTAYYLLRKLAEQGWVTETSEQEGNRPPRRVYRITTQGEAAFLRLLRKLLPHYEPTYFDNDLPLAYLHELPLDEARALLTQRREQILQTRESLRAVPAHRGSVQWLIEHQRRHVELELQLLDEILATLAHNE